MSLVLASLLPVLFVIAAGWLLKNRRFGEDDFWNGVERLVFYVLFPSVIIETLARADLASVAIGKIFLALVGPMALVALFLVLTARLWERFGVDGPGFTSVFQGALRWNTFIALAVAAGLYGAPGLSVMAVAVATIIPLANIGTTFAMLHYARPPDQASVSLGMIVRGLATNPLIWSCIVGAMINVTGLPLPGVVLGFLHILGAAALPLGLLVVGASLDLKRLRRPTFGTALASGLKLLILPALAMAVSWAVGLDPLGRSVVLISTAVPTASVAYIAARQMGGDAPMMAEIITFQTLLAAVTMPLVLAAFT